MTQSTSYAGLAAFLVGLFLLFTPVTALALVNINTAGLSELETLSGIGPSKAQAIIDYRTNVAPFAVIEDVMKVSGIGTATFNSIKDFITVGDTQSSQSQTTTTTNSPETTQTTQATQTTQTTSAPTDSYVAPPVPQVFADAGGDKIVIVGADTQFTGRAYNRSKEDVERVRFMWNFGDGSTAEGSHVLHHYEYPGRYAAVLTIAESRDSVSDYFTVTAEPAKLAFYSYPDGSVGIENRAGRDLDLSGWIVRSFNQLFVLPEHSRIFSGATMRIPQKTLKFWSSARTELAYPNGAVLLSAGESSAEPPEQVMPKVPATQGVVYVPEPRRATPEQEATPDTEYTEERVEVGVSQEGQTAAASLFGGYWWLGALGLALTVSGTLVLIGRMRRTEWDIEEA